MRRIFVTLLLALLWCGAQAQERLRLDSIPSSLTEVSDRAHYLAMNYWNHYDFAQVAMDEGDEVAFVDFIEVLKVVDSARLEGAVANHLRLVAQTKNEDVLYYVSDLYEKYLDTAESPMQNERLFKIFLEQYIAQPQIEKVNKMRAEYQLESANRNGVGAKAPAFKSTTIGGESLRVSDLAGQKTLMLLFDPECGVCDEVISQIKTSPYIYREVMKGMLRIVAIYPGNDTKTWRTKKSKIPIEWVNAIAPESMKEDYSVTSIPMLYLLSDSMTVLLRNCTVDKINAYLSDKQ